MVRFPMIVMIFVESFMMGEKSTYILSSPQNHVESFTILCSWSTTRSFIQLTFESLVSRTWISRRAKSAESMLISPSHTGDETSFLGWKRIFHVFLPSIWRESIR